ncbi:unnamed protein product [Heterobilharzia americana]|nr:unnamed protein product [Heterobilharzia americana]
MLAEELETVISTRNNLINSPAPTDANSSFEQDLPTYKCQLRLFLSCLDAVGQDKSQHCPVPSSTTDPSIILRDQFFDSLISGVLKPSDLAHCQNIKTLESIVRRARLADSVQNKISLGTSVVSSNVNTNQPDLCATSTQTSTTITPSNNPLTSVPALSQPTEVDKHTNEALDTTSEHGKHLYDMHCKRCTGQTKQPMKLPSSKKSVPSPSPPPSSGASLSLLSVKTESVSNTFSSEKISPDPNSTELSLSKSSISPAAILAEKTVPVSVKLSPKSADECSVFNKPNYLEDRKNMVKCLDPRKESISLQNSVNHHMSKMQLNQKRSHPSFEEYCPVSIFTHDKSIPPKSLSSCYHPPPPINSFVSTGLLDLPLPPAQHNSSFTSQSDDNDSVSPPYIVKEKINSKCCLWTGMLSLSTQYSGREHMYSLEINVHPFGYIHAKVSNDSRKVFIENTIWESLLSSKQTSLVISRGVNLVSLPVYLGQTLLDSTHPRELFALHVTPRTKQMSHIYADIFNHLKEINACGSLEPRFQGTYDCLLYPLIANTHLPDILLPPNLLSKFEFIGCDVMTENHLLIILTRPVYVTPSVVEILSPFPSSPTSNDVADEKSTSKAEILAVRTTTDISSPVPLNIETYPSMSTSLSKKAYMPTFFQQPIEEEVLIKDERQEVPTIETVSINASGDVDLRPFSTAGNVSQSHSVIPEWFPSFTEDVDYRTYIPQQHTDRVPCVSQTLCNISSQSVIDDCNRSHSLSRFREKAYYLTPNERIHYVEQQIGYPRKELKDHVLRDSVTNRSNSLLPSPLSTDSHQELYTYHEQVHALFCLHHR